MKKILIYLCLLLTPLIVLGYSNEVYLGGNTIGININTDGILVVGFYQINGKFNKGNPELKVGDYIIKVNETEVNTLKELSNAIEENNKDNSVYLTYRRDNKEYITKLDLIKDNNNYKTGLYVKDSIIGIGTLTYVDPGNGDNMTFGSLGHEIIDSNTNKIIELKDGYIFKNAITSIDKSRPGYAGSKNAKYYYNNIYGSILSNTDKGLFGKYSNGTEDMKLIEVGKEKDVNVGKAYIYTVLMDNIVGEYEINIENINETNNTKNITFNITDKNLIDKTGGVVQGMSGSPIVQNNKLIGVVTHVIVDNPIKGYGLFIRTMLSEGDKIN